MGWGAGEAALPVHTWRVLWQGLESWALVLLEVALVQGPGMCQSCHGLFAALLSQAPPPRDRWVMVGSG